MNFKTILGWTVALSVLFLFPLISPVVAFVFLNPVGFWQMLMFFVVGVVLYIITFTLILFIAYIIL